MKYALSTLAYAVWINTVALLSVLIKSCGQILHGVVMAGETRPKLRNAQTEMQHGSPNQVYYSNTLFHFILFYTEPKALKHFSHSFCCCCCCCLQFKKKNIIFLLSFKLR